jgi:transcription-repair coupling factor (superfamily II helicase)
VRRLDRLNDFRQEMSDRFGSLPEPAEWLMRLAELRLLATQWKIASIHLERSAEVGSSAMDVVLGYRNPRRIRELADSSDGRLRVVDDASAYFRLTGQEQEPKVLYDRLRNLMNRESV